MNWGFLLTKIVKFTAGLKTPLQKLFWKCSEKKTIFLSIGNSRKTFAKLSLFLSRYWSAVQNIWSNKNWLPEKCFLSAFPPEKCIWWSFFLAIGAAQPTTCNCTENWHHCKCFLTFKIARRVSAVKSHFGKQETFFASRVLWRTLLHSMYFPKVVFLKTTRNSLLTSLSGLQPTGCNAISY